MSSVLLSLLAAQAVSWINHLCSHLLGGWDSAGGQGGLVPPLPPSPLLLSGSHLTFFSLPFTPLTFVSRHSMISRFQLSIHLDHTSNTATASETRETRGPNSEPPWLDLRAPGALRCHPKMRALGWGLGEPPLSCLGDQLYGKFRMLTLLSRAVLVNPKFKGHLRSLSCLTLGPDLASLHTGQRPPLVQIWNFLFSI